MTISEAVRPEICTALGVIEAKERVIGLNKILSEESTDVMNALVFSELAGKAEDYYEYEKKINKVTLEQVKKLAKFKNYSTAAIVPK